jgi:hypothetical protein
MQRNEVPTPASAGVRLQTYSVKEARWKTPHMV